MPLQIQILSVIPLSIQANPQLEDSNQFKI